MPLSRIGSLFRPSRSMAAGTQTRTGEVLSRVFDHVRGVDEVVNTTVNSMVSNGATTLAIAAARPRAPFTTN